MDPLSRRKFLARGAAAAGAVAVVGPLGGGSAAADAVKGHSDPELGWWPESSQASEPFVVYIRDAARGEVAVFKGEDEIVYIDRALVGRLQRAARRAGR